MSTTTTRWLIVVDTEVYAGNFEREMCGWMTGLVGDCGVGQRQATKALETLSQELKGWCEEHVVRVADDHGTSRPVAIHPTPGWFNDGQGNCYKEGADPEAVRAVYRAASEARADHTRKVYGHMPKYAERMAREWIENHQEPGYHPVYFSVALVLAELPPFDLKEELITRAYSFTGATPTLVRVVKEATVVTEVTVDSGWPDEYGA